MPSFAAERAIEDAHRAGRAILKFITPNELGLTGSHQYGYYLPKSAWRIFTPHPPERGRNDKNEVRVTWPDGRRTDSVVTWYGKRTRSEYRLTRFGKDFPWRAADVVGDLLVLVPWDLDRMSAHVLDLEDDIEDVQHGLGVFVAEQWAVYDSQRHEGETEEECFDRAFREFADPLAEFPPGVDFSNAACDLLRKCVASFATESADVRLMAGVETEYRLFRFVERQLCHAEISRLFGSIDEFLSVARTILNRRKSRAGRSLENHIEKLLLEARIPHDMRSNVEGRPDILIPGADDYRNNSYPEDGLFAVGVKTTCKDRWRQVLQEAPRVRKKHIITIQQGISTNQLREMNEAGVTLVVPLGLHSKYPPERPVRMLTVEAFLEEVRQTGKRYGWPTY